MRQEYVLFAFDSTHAAIEAEKLLKDLGAVMMPTLREISASCGMSLRLRPEDREYAERRMAGSDIEGWHLYRVVPEDGKPDCTLLRNAGDGQLNGKKNNGDVGSKDQAPDGADFSLRLCGEAGAGCPCGNS